jgi:hypothetical protein
VEAKEGDIGDGGGRMGEARVIRDLWAVVTNVGLAAQ